MMTPVLSLSCLLIGCSGNHVDTGDSLSDDTGSTNACGASAADLNNNGVADACERDLLATFQTDVSVLFDPTKDIVAWLAFDTDGAESTWVQFQPGIEAWYDNPGPFTVDTADLEGWAAVEARLVDDVDEPLCTRVVQQDFDRTHLWSWQESYLGIFGKLKGDVINALGMEVVYWDLSPTGEDMSVAWYFFGADGG